MKFLRGLAGPSKRKAVAFEEPKPTKLAAPVLAVAVRSPSPRSGGSGSPPSGGPPMTRVVSADPDSPCVPRYLRSVGMKNIVVADCAHADDKCRYRHNFVESDRLAVIGLLATCEADDVRKQARRIKGFLNSKAGPK